jgi:hypothetical protein
MFVATADSFPVAPTIRGGIWKIAGGTSPITAIARSEDPAPGVVPVANFVSLASSISPTGPVNSTGTTAFLGHTSTSLEGIWTGTTSALTLVALEDGAATATGIGAGVTYRDLNPPALNDSASLAFHARLDGTGISGTNEFVILAGSASSLNVVAQEGSLAPGAATGTTFNGDFLDPLIDAAGNVCFKATTQGPSPDFDLGTGIWAGPPPVPPPSSSRATPLPA